MMNKLTTITKLVVVGFISALLLCNIYLTNADSDPLPLQKIPGNPQLLTQQEYFEFLNRVSSALYETYVAYGTEAYETYNEMGALAKSYFINNELEAAIATMEDLIEYLKTIQDKFFIYITDSGLNLLQTPSALALTQGERTYIPLLISNETEQGLTLSLASENTHNRHISPQTITVSPGSLEYASAVIPLIDVVSIDAGEQIIPIEIIVAETGETLGTSFTIEVSELSPQLNLFPYLPSRQSIESDFTTSLVIADIDGNGLSDIYAGNYGYPEAAQNVIYYSQGKGAFSIEQLIDPGPKGTHNVITADMDGDGVADHIIDVNINVGIGDGNNLIRPINDLNNPVSLNQDALDSTKAIAQDINLNDTDTKPPLLVCNIDESVQLFKNDGLGSFETTPVWSSNGVYRNIGLGDVDGDGVKDLAVSFAGYALIYRGQVGGGGNISFIEDCEEALWQSPADDRPNSIKQLVFSDFDNDGDEDFIIVAKKVRLYRNDGGSLTLYPYWFLDSPYQIPSSLAIDDVNGDGLNDIVVGFYSSFDLEKRLLGGENKLYLGKTEGAEITFDTSPAWSSFYSDKTTAVALLDCDNDGLLDLFVANDGQNYLYFNTGPKTYPCLLPDNPSSFYKGNVHSIIDIVEHEPGFQPELIESAAETIGVTIKINRVAYAQGVQELYEDLNLKVAGFWPGNGSPFEGLFYFNLVDAEITAVKEGGAQAIMLFNPGWNNWWTYASNNKKFIDNLDVYAWMVQKFAERYGPSGLLAQTHGWDPNDKVLYGTSNEPEAELWPTSEIVVKKQDCLFNVVKEVDPNILVTTANHGGGAGAIADFNQVSEALGLGGYHKFDIARIQTYYAGLGILGLAPNDECLWFNEFFNPSFPDLMCVQATRDLLADPQSVWANYSYGMSVGEGNGNASQCAEIYLPGEPPYNYSEDPLPFFSQSQLANETVGGFLRNVSNLVPHIATNNTTGLAAPRTALKLLVEMLQDYQYAGIQGTPEILNEGNVIVYEFENNADSSFLCAIRAHPGYADAPFEPQTITLDLAYSDSTILIKNMFDGQQFTGDDVVAVNEDFLNAPTLAERWVTIEDVTHGQYNQADLDFTVENGQITITLPNYDYYYIKEIAQGTNVYPDLDPITTPQQVYEGAEDFNIQLGASDPNLGDILTFSFSPAIANAYLNQLSNNSAEFIFEPDYTQANIYTVTFTVTDQGGLSDEQNVVIHVLNINQAPVFDPIEPQSVAEAELLEFTVSATDLDEDELTFWVDDPPEGFRIDQASVNSAICSWQPNYTQAGSYDVVISMTDREILDPITISVPIAVTNTNQLPQIHPLGGPYTVEEMTPIAFTVIAFDPDNELLTYSSPNLPEGASIDPVTGDFSWMPSYEQGADPYEEYIITIIAQDPYGGEDQDNVVINVENLNRAPVLDPLGPFTVNEGELLTFTVTGSDPDGDSITYGADHLPEGASFDSTTGEFSWTPWPHQEGTYSINFYAQDNYGLRSGPIPVEITVLDTQ